MDDRSGRARCWEAVVSQHVVPVKAKALIYARETGAVDNAACQDFSGLGMLWASNVLLRLRDPGLLEKQRLGQPHLLRSERTPASSGSLGTRTPKR